MPLKIIDEELVDYTGDKPGEYVEIPEGITHIRDEAFIRADISGVKLPKTLKSIGRFCFNGCTNLEEIEIPDSVIKIETHAFSNCRNLKRVILSKSLTEIKDSVFSHTGLEYINIPSSVKVIEAEAFDNCTHLKSVKLPNELTQIGPDAFKNCDNLISINIPGSVKAIQTYAFCNCTNLSEIIFNDGLEIIENNAFEYCKALKHLNLPNTIKKIFPKAFSRCITIKTVKIPPSLEELSSYTFFGCENLSNVDLSQSTLTSLPSTCFAYCKNLRYIKIPAEVCMIPSSVYGSIIFEHSSLEYIDVDPENKMFKSVDGMLLSKDESILYQCPPGYKQSDITLPSVEKINTYALHGCENMKRLVIPESVTCIDNSACRDNSELEELIIESGDKPLIIGTSAFAAGLDLKIVQLPKRISAIAPNAFGQAALQELKLYGDDCSYAIKDIKNMLFYTVTYDVVEHADKNIKIDLDTIISVYRLDKNIKLDLDIIISVYKLTHNKKVEAAIRDNCERMILHCEQIKDKQMFDFCLQFLTCDTINDVLAKIKNVDYKTTLERYKYEHFSDKKILSL